MALGVLGAAWEVCKKDARIEWRTREIVSTAGVFAVVVGILASIAYHTIPKLNRAMAAGTIWIAVFFAAVLSFSRIWQRERDESALTGLLVSPIPRASIFLGKAMATFVTILVIALPLIVNRFGGNVVVVAAVGMLSGFCGTLLTPMAANFNIVPVALLELPDQNAVIKAQIPTAVLLLAANIAIMYFFVYHK